MRQAAAGYESESSYHSDCGHKSPIRKRPVGQKGAQARRRFGESKDKFKRRTQSGQRQEDESDADYERRMRSLEKGTLEKIFQLLNSKDISILFSSKGFPYLKLTLRARIRL